MTRTLPTLGWLLALWLMVSAALAAEPPKPPVAPMAPASAASPLLGLGLGGPTQALTQYKIDSWQTEQGLPLNTVQALLQTRNGYLWIGTAGGLARFDGVRFTSFDATQAPEVASQPVFGLMEDRDQQLWIGHSKGALLYRQGSFHSVIGAEQTAGRRVWAFAQAGDGSVWAASENGLMHLREGKLVKRYQLADGLPTLRLRSLAFDREGVLWIGTTGGGLVALEKSGQFRTLNPDSGFPHLQVRHVLADPVSGVWAATAGGGLVHLTPGGQRVYTVADGLPTDHLTALARDAKGALWIGSWGAGVVRMNAEDGRFSAISSAEGLSGSQIWSILSDREGSVWVGTWVGGLNRLRNRPFTVFGTPEGLAHDNVRAVLHGRGGVSWVSTSGGGISRIQGERISTLSKKDGLPTDEISGLHEDADGTLWIGSYTAGLARLREGRIDSFGVEQGLPGVEVRSVLRDRSGTLWVGTRAGLARFNGQGFEAVQAPGLPQEGVMAMLQDRSGTLWLGTTGAGLVSFRDGRFKTLTTTDGLLSNWIMALHEDAEGTLWIGTNGEGLNRLRDGQLQSIRTADGLWDGVVQSILEDRSGNLWMTCNRGFFRVARAELDAFAQGRIKKVSSAGYGPGDALRGTTFAGGLQPAGAVDSGGRLWLPSANGLVIVDPARLPGAGPAPAVRVEHVVLDGVRRAADAGIVLPPDAAPLTIRYTAMTLLYADRARFRYQLEGLTRDWVDAGNSREAAFPALPHGQYRFRVAASTDGGLNWSDASAPLDITVQPHFYQTRWFSALMLLALVAGIALFERLRTRRLHARQAEMERLVAQRTEELRLANEHLQRLSFVDSLTGLANRRRFDEALAEEWRRERRTHTPLALVMADIDAFKRYNDLLGHPEGDRCLTAVAGVFAQAVARAGDLAARYGGEEFVVLLPGVDRAGALALAEQIRAGCEALALAHPDSPVAPVVTLSLGVAACVPGQDGSVEALLEQADAALYQAKQAGRNRVC